MLEMRSSCLRAYTEYCVASMSRLVQPELPPLRSVIWRSAGLGNHFRAAYNIVTVAARVCSFRCGQTGFLTR